ncbi:unnamed protein product [Adineta ricciae]|uniref:Uncharacterized protein n=1 Tax=Adineta ricciae TaxID=249248 RepID=A0A814VZA5_ADIRI|nr:unnamed protein product [Adineta ricciae]
MNQVSATHFRGSMISWRVLNESSSTNVTIEILQRHAWRYNSFTPLCTDLTISNKSPLLGSGDIKCVSTCPAGVSTLGSVQVPCTGYSINEQYAAGEGRFTFNVRKNVSFVASFTGKGWFGLVYSADADWSVAVQIQTYKRPSGRYNNAPVVTMLPIYILRRLKTYVLKINVADNDFDPYQCLWSNGKTQCGNLTDNIPGATLNATSCYLTFTPSISGYYAVALTVVDYETPTSPLSSYLSQVPIQLVFRVYDSPNPCWTGPVYMGDLSSDQCIYLTAGTTYKARIRLQVQCPNATVNSIISVNPTGLTKTALVPDPFDVTIFIYFIYYFASPDQYGQNLYCFSGIDSIGNQGPSTCLRFIIEAPAILMNPLYIQNVTRYPIGVVTSVTSTWTILTDGVQYTRPTTESYIRFKRLSDNSDVFRLNAVTETSNVLYLDDRLVLTSNIIWTPGEQYYIYFDSGILALASTCTKASMPIIDPAFWPFRIPYETTSSTTTSTSTTSGTSTLRPRTVPSQRTIISRTTTIHTTVTVTTGMEGSTTKNIVPAVKKSTSHLTISEIIAITLATALFVILSSKILIYCVRFYIIQAVVLRHGLEKQIYGFMPIGQSIQSTTQYKLAINKRTRTYASQGKANPSLVLVDT